MTESRVIFARPNTMIRKTEQSQDMKKKLKCYLSLATTRDKIELRRRTGIIKTIN
jgi:hypothetical protein